LPTLTRRVWTHVHPLGLLSGRPLCHHRQPVRRGAYPAPQGPYPEAQRRVFGHQQGELLLCSGNNRISGTSCDCSWNFTNRLQGFLGEANFYRSFVPVAARILRPLTDVLHRSPGPAFILGWSEEISAAFQAAKAALCKTVSLAHPSASAMLALMVDASAEHVCTSLQQRMAVTAAWQPLVFIYKKTGACTDPLLSI
jgi:hypothetical protein